jgi:hypothetical protein
VYSYIGKKQKTLSTSAISIADTPSAQTSTWETKKKFGYLCYVRLIRKINNEIQLSNIFLNTDIVTSSFWKLNFFLSFQEPSGGGGIHVSSPDRGSVVFTYWMCKLVSNANANSFKAIFIQQNNNLQDYNNNQAF